MASGEVGGWARTKDDMSQSADIAEPLRGLLAFKAISMKIKLRCTLEGKVGARDAADFPATPGSGGRDSRLL